MSKSEFTVSLDAMGGDGSPLKVIKGAELVRKKNKNLNFIFFGDKDKINPILNTYKKLSQISIVEHTDEVISDDDKPSNAIRNGKNSSMRLAINAVKDGRADFIVSAGNTGALMGMSLFVLKRLPGISRPAIASYFPTFIEGKNTVALDLGANVDASSRSLLEFAIIGGVYSRYVLEVKNPKIGLLNVGEEEGKGNDKVKEASTLINDYVINVGEYAGFAEGNDLISGKFDVVVSDGFTGNIALKASEGTAKLIAKMAKRSFKSSFLSYIAFPFMLPALHKLKSLINPSKYNGGILMGLQGTCIKSHGSADDIGFANAIEVGFDIVKHDFISNLALEIERSGLNKKLEE